MRNTQKKLVIVAHPDDELIFFAQVIFQSPKEIHLILVTDGDGDGQSAERILQFTTVLKKCGIESFELWKFQDKYDSIIHPKEFNSLLAKTISHFPKIEEVYTHGPLGEYGHPHHIQVSKLVHNHKDLSHLHIYHPNTLEIEGAKTLILTNDQWKRVNNLMTNEYRGEYQRFYNLLPIMKKRSYLLDKNFVANIIDYTEQKLILRDSDQKEIGPYGPYLEILNLMSEQLLRPF